MTLEVLHCAQNPDSFVIMKRTGALLTALTLMFTLAACGGSKEEPDRYASIEGECLVDHVDAITASDRDFLAKIKKTGDFIDTEEPSGYRVTKQTEGGHTIAFEVEKDPTCLPAVALPDESPAEPSTHATEDAPVEPVAPVAPAERDVTDAGLDFGTASVACDRAGKTAFPFGWDAHWIMGLIGQEITADGIFLKASVDVKNEFDAKAEMVVECTVRGDEYAPEVTAFEVYSHG